MKMIFQQTIREGFRNRLNVLAVQIQEISVVPFFQKNIFPVDAAIMDMVVGIIQ
jgi:hypothetical protein